jgi:condensin-2 complex subunit H2
MLAGDADVADDHGDMFGGGFADDGDDYGPADDFGHAYALEDAAEAWRQQGGAAMAAGGGGTVEGQMEPAPEEMTYEELCRAHVEAFITAAAAAEVQTELAARVTSWRAKMAPTLQEEDARPEFDIHEYGEQILGSMAALSCHDAAAAAPAKGGKRTAAAVAGSEVELTFEEVVAGSGAVFDISRSFSSMLQLVNNGNVRLTKLGGSNEDFRLALLDAAMPHRQIAEFGGRPEASTAAAADERGSNEVLGEQVNSSPIKAAGPSKATASKSSKRRKAA